MTDEEIETLSPLKLPVFQKPLVIAYGADELPALVHDSLNLHARRTAEGAPGTLMAIDGANHFDILEELRRPEGEVAAAARKLVSR